MFDSFWAFLADPQHREVLGWIGGGIVVAAGGLWAVFKFYAKKPKPPTTQTVTADRGSVGIGGNNRNSPISIDNSTAGKR